MHKIFVCVLVVLMMTCLTACGSSGTVVTSAGTDAAAFGDVADTAISTTAVPRDGLLAVYVCGAVANPGVYYMEQGSIKQDALHAAGGFSGEADEEYINLAEGISAGEKIYFPSRDETEAYLSIVQEEASGLVNINTADVETLMTLPGIGKSKAKAIVEYREEHGSYKSVDDIKQISGIKDGVYNNIKDYICVE
ncbi:MAG: ComEA family DNA-binding protein [Clostridium sp.]|nr:ComEA family DNA-binding protein [Clostridium sp.]MCM1399740.1 ComEA family DNA-binding protein [Clostridium sp.]MCM1460425.1 ComEA family DNA-binding protein [Bacteroides sp.]